MKTINAIHLNYAAKLSNKWGPPLRYALNKSKFREERITLALHQTKPSALVFEICRKGGGVIEQNSYRWKRKYAGMGIVELHRMKDIAK